MVNIMTMKKVFATGLSAAVLSLGSLALNPVTAQAASISQSLSVSMTPTDWVRNLSFSKFDSSLGTLNSVSILMGSTVVGGGTLKNKNTTSATGTATLSSEVELFMDNPDFDSLGIVKPIFTDRLRTIDATALAGGATKTYTDVTVSDSKTFSFNDDLALAYFTGAGTGSLIATGTGISGWNGSSNMDVSFTTSASASYTITYDYSAAAVPEPLTMLGAATAVGFGAAFKRRALKNNKKG
jgi:hypothetical protein